MKIKVGNKIYDGENEPVMVILTEKKKELFNENFLKTDAKKYCVYPDTKKWNDNNYKKIKKWMGIKNENLV